MKRMITFFLASVMLLSAVFMCSADAKAADAEKKPFYYSNWDSVDSEEFPNIWSKPYFWATRDGDEVTVSYGGTTIEDIAKSLKKTFDKHPDNANMRIINITPVERRYLAEMVTDHIYMTDGAKKAAQWMNDFLKEYKRIGGKLDGIASDLEFHHGLNWYLFSEAYNTGDTEVYYDIINNPEYKTKVRPELEARGFKFYPSNDKTKTELYALHPYAGSEYASSKLIWDTVVQNLWREYLNEAFYEPLQKYYPDAVFWDYRAYDSYGWIKDIPETGRNQYLAGNTNKTGTHSSNTAYNYAPWTPWVVESANSTTYNKPVSHNDAIYENNAFNMTLWEVNNFKHMYAATDNKQIEVDLTHFNYTLMRDSSYEEGTTSSGTPYHVEGYFHAGLLNAEFGGYIIQSEVGDAAEYQYRMEVVQAIMDELNRLVGYADRKPIEVRTNWNDSFILSGMYANGRNIWRITPDTVSGVSKKDFLVSKKNGQVVFYNKGQTITFPKGTVIEDGFIPAVGTCGYWVETPADVVPVITSDTDRYSQYPAFSENFNTYKSRTDFNPDKTEYSHTWETLLLDGASATIKESQNSADNKVLALQGNAYINNITVPKLLTAGDNYATQQGWEVTVRLSALPKGDAEIKLLTATSGSGTDNGFRIASGKLYYAQAGKYQAFSDITLATDTEYTLKRTVDYRSYTGSYYVYDAKGALLAKAENVSLSKLSLPIEKIGFATTKFDDNTVFLDNYKLYAVGVTADFEIYDANTGIEITALNTMQETDTAYRLSWINASDEAKAYNVVAAFSGGGKQIVETVTMMPGTDGVATGIVKVSDKPVMFSLEETEVKLPAGQQPSEPTVPEDTTQTTPSSDPDESYTDPDDDTGHTESSSPATENTNTSGGQNPARGTSPVLLVVIIVLLVASACAVAFVLVKRNMPQKVTGDEQTPEGKTEETEETAETDESAETKVIPPLTEPVASAETSTPDPTGDTEEKTE